MSGLTPETKAYIRRIACSAWQRLGLTPPAELRAVCDFLNVELIYETPQNGSSGLYLLDGDRARIYVSPTMPRIGAVRLVTAHEIGHAILGTSGVVGRPYSHNSVLERKCDYFARHLLVPDTALAQRIAAYRHGRDNDRTAILADEFGVSYDLMRRRLREFIIDYPRAR